MVDAPVKPRWTAIEIEETQYMGNSPEVARAVTRIWTVYKFDRNLVTHICSQDKHYFLEPLYINVEFRPDVSEEDRATINDNLTDLGDGDYFLERDIERLIESGAAKTAEYGDIDEDETEDDVREHWQGNCPF